MNALYKALEATSQAELAISVPPDEFRLYIEKAGKKLAKDHTFKGFRPGKAPLSLVMSQLGQERVLHEAMDLAWPHFFVEAVLEQGITPIHRPNITVEELGMDAPFRFTVVVDVLPKTTLGDMGAISAKKRVIEVSDEDVDKELQHLARMRSDYLDVARGAQPGDKVTMDFTIRDNGQVMDGGESKNHPFTVGEGQFIPEFEKGIEGMKAGETNTFPVTFPDTFPQEDRRGKTVEATVTVHALQERVLPAIDDAFAQKIGSFKDLAHLKTEISKNLALDKEEREMSRYQGELAQQLMEASTFGVIPESLLTQEIDARVKELASMLSLQQKTLDAYLTEQKKTMEALREELKPEAERRIKTGLALRAFGEAHKIEAGDEEIEEKMNEQLKYYKTVPQAQKNVDADALRERVHSTLLNRKILEKLATQAGKPVSM